MIKSMMASADEEGLEKPEDSDTQPEVDVDSKEFQRNAAEISAIVDQEKESLNQLAQATGETQSQ